MNRTLDKLVPSTNSDKERVQTLTFPDIQSIPRTQSYWSRVFKSIPVTQKTLREWIDKLAFLEKHPEKLVINQPIRFTLAKGRSLTITHVKTKIIIALVT
jgi:hypothetical protein